MQVSLRTLAVIGGVVALGVGVAYAVGHRRGQSREQRINLARYRWKSRVLIVFGPHAEDERFLTQMEELADRAKDLKSRDVVVLPVLARGKAGVATRRDGAILRELFAAEPRHFRVVLIGKDGSVKLREEFPLDANRLFDVIDAMPMRQQEMKARRGRFSPGQSSIVPR